MINHTINWYPTKLQHQSVFIPERVTSTFSSQSLAFPASCAETNFQLELELKPSRVDGAKMRNTSKIGCSGSFPGNSPLLLPLNHEKMKEHDGLNHWILDFVEHPILEQTQMEELCLYSFGQFLLPVGSSE